MTTPKQRAELAARECIKLIMFNAEKTEPPEDEQSCEEAMSKWVLDTIPLKQLFAVEDALRHIKTSLKEMTGIADFMQPGNVAHHLNRIKWICRLCDNDINKHILALDNWRKERDRDKEGKK